MISNFKKENQLNQRPFVIIANSSKYILHYRKSLLKKLLDSKQNVIAIAPFDKDSKTLSQHVNFIPWKKDEKFNWNFLNIFNSYIDLFFILKKVNPKLIHSHTLYANLIVSIISALLGFKNVLSFAGLGRLMSGSIFSNLILFIILKITFLFSSIEGNYFLKRRNNKQRTSIIFQNDLDRLYVEKNFQINLKVNNIPGSGLPEAYLSHPPINNFKSGKLNIIFCSRLLKTKGIKMFIDIARECPNNKFSIYGEIDKFSNESLSRKEVDLFEKQINNIKFFGNCQNPLLNLNKEFFNILIVPSIYGEGLPRAILEAGSQLIPVISNEIINKFHFYSDHIYMSKYHTLEGYLREIINIKEDIESGLIFEKLNSFRDLIFSNYTEDVIVEKTMKIYKEMKML